MISFRLKFPAGEKYFKFFISSQYPLRKAIGKKMDLYTDLKNLYFTPLLGKRYLGEKPSGRKVLERDNKMVKHLGCLKKELLIAQTLTISLSRP